MKLEDFDYYLPEELIAQVPIKDRDQSRLLVLDRINKTMEDKVFKDIVDYLEPGDCLVRNNTKVLPARLYGEKDTGAKVEFLLLKNIEGDIWEVMVRPGNKLKQGAKVTFGNGILKAEILESTEDGTRLAKFEYNGIFNEILDEIGLMPLPPYIHESLKDNDRYQTVYAKYQGSAAAPTAGLHFTDELFNKLKDKGVEVANVTLHVGIGTFRPVKSENIEDHIMHSEEYTIPKETADIINSAKEQNRRIVAVGTTSIRALESSVENGKLVARKSSTNIFIYGDYNFKIVDAVITNFHLPKSTLVMLVSSFMGKDNLFNAYKVAVENQYRFFSFGDSMYIGDNV